MTYKMKGFSGFKNSPLKQKVSIGSKTYDNLDPEMRSAVEGQLGMPSQKDLEKEKQKNDPKKKISF